MDSLIESLAAEVVRAIRIMPHQKRQVEHKTETSYILSVLRPFVEAHVTGRAPKPVRDHADKRERLWLVSLELWHGEPGQLKRVASSDGRTFGPDGNVTRYGAASEAIRGLDAVADYVSQGCAFYGAYESEFGYDALSLAFRYLRSAITLGKGRATMRRTSKDQRWHLICDVFREGSFPNE